MTNWLMKKMHQCHVWKIGFGSRIVLLIKAVYPYYGKTVGEVLQIARPQNQLPPKKALKPGKSTLIEILKEVTAKKPKRGEGSKDKSKTKQGSIAVQLLVSLFLKLPVILFFL